MVANTQLTALDHNANSGRQQAATSTGDEVKLQYKIVFPKHTKEWVAKPVMEKTTRDHLKPMLDAVVARKKQKKNKKEVRRSQQHTSPKILQANPGLQKMM